MIDCLLHNLTVPAQCRLQKEDQSSLAHVMHMRVCMQACLVYQLDNRDPHGERLISTCPCILHHRDRRCVFENIYSTCPFMLQIMTLPRAPERLLHSNSSKLKVVRLLNTALPPSHVRQEFWLSKYHTTHARQIAASNMTTIMTVMRQKQSVPQPLRLGLVEGGDSSSH